MPEFTCATCGKVFALPQATMDRFPGWTPKLCLGCKGREPRSDVRGPSSPKSEAAARTRLHAGLAAAQEENLTVAEVLAKYFDGPKSGVFTDGAASPNPGPGGWGAVYVVDNSIIAERWGDEPHTTNNRMELAALLAGIQMVPAGTPTTVWTDSQLCVNTFAKWAHNWAARNWRRKDGSVKNIELVKEIYYLLKERPELTMSWIAAHNGQRWNEYADSLATAYRRTVR